MSSLAVAHIKYLHDAVPTSICLASTDRGFGQTSALSPDKSSAKRSNHRIYGSAQLYRMLRITAKHKLLTQSWKRKLKSHC